MIENVDPFRSLCRFHCSIPWNLLFDRGKKAARCFLLKIPKWIKYSQFSSSLLCNELVISHTTYRARDENFPTTIPYFFSILRNLKLFFLIHRKPYTRDMLKLLSAFRNSLSRCSGYMNGTRKRKSHLKIVYSNKNQFYLSLGENSLFDVLARDLFQAFKLYYKLTIELHFSC